MPQEIGKNLQYTGLFKLDGAFFCGSFFYLDSDCMAISWSSDHVIQISKDCPKKVLVSKILSLQHI